MEKKMIKKLLAILMIITILSTDFFVLGSSLITYATTQMETATKEPNIEFSVYFKNDANEKVSNIDKSIKTEDLRLYASVKVKNEGYFNGAIEIINGDFNVKREILSSQIAKIEGNRIELKQINAEEPVEIELGIEPIFTEKMPADMLLKTKVVLTGKYVSSENENGEEIVPAEREVSVSYKVDESAKQEIKARIITNTKIEEKRIVQILIRARLQDNQYPVESTILTVDVPRLSGVEPDDVDFLITDKKSPLITQSWIKGTDSTVISMQNQLDMNNKITWNKEGYDEVILTYTYPGTVDASAINVNIKPEITVYNSKNKIPTEVVELTNSSEANNIVIAKPEIATTELYKGQLYENITATTKKEIQYNTSTTLIVTKTGIAEGVTINEKPDEFVTDGIDVEAETKYISTEIDKQNIIDVLGPNGSVTIKSGTNPLLEIEDISTIEDENIVINYADVNAGTIDQLSIILSEPQNNGLLEIKHKKAITGTYTREEIKAIKGLEKVNNIKTTNIDTESSTNVQIKETISRADFVIVSDAKLSTIEPNDLTLGIIFVTEGLQYDLFESPTITIQMPSYVQNVTFNTAPVIQNVNDNEISITGYNYYKNTNQLVITTSGAQTAYPNGILSELYIPLDLKLTLSKLAPSEETTIKMLYTNASASAYYRGTTTGESEQDITIQAPTGLVKYFNLDLNSNTSASEEITQKVVSENKGDEINFEITLVNNKGADLNDVKILGKLPTTGNAENTMTTMLKSLTAQNGTIYFTENSNATVDTENSSNAWTQTFTSTAKMFLIKLDNLSKGSNYTASAKVQLPNEIVDGLEAYTQYEVVYDIEGKTETELSRRIWLEMVSDFEVELRAQVGQETLKNGDAVKEGEVVKYTATVKNNTSKTAENVVLKANVPDGTVVVESVGDVYSSDPFYYEEKTDIDEINITIPTLAVGETYIKEYEVRVDMDAVSTVQAISNKVIVEYNELKVETDEIRNVLEESDIRVTIRRVDDESIELIAGHVANYEICIENFSDKPAQNLEMQIVTEEYEIISVRRSDKLDYQNRKLDEENRMTIAEISAKGYISFALYGKINKDVEELNISAVVAVSDKEQKSNVITQGLPKIDAEVILTSPQDNKAIKPNDIVTYNIIIKNIGDSFNRIVTIKDTIPEYLQVESISINGELYENPYIDTISNEINQVITTKMDKGEIYKIDIVTKVKEIPLSTDGEVITNKVDLIISEVNEDTSEVIKHTLDSGQKNVISGLVWEDVNVNGRIDEDECVLTGLEIGLYDISKNNYLTDIDGEIIQTETDSNGEYMLTHIPNGSYIVVFKMQGLQNYEPTITFSEGVDTTANSKAKWETITIDGKAIDVAGYKVDLEEDIIFNVNLGIKDKNAVPPVEPEDPEEPKDPEQPEKDYKKITGYAWLDLDRDGEKDDSETALKDVKVKVYDVSTKDYLKDNKGNSIQKTTDAAGKYEFDNIEKGSYILVFEYNQEEYEPTTYLADGIDVAKNSKVVLKKINIDGEEKLLTVTDTITVQDNIENINIGLREKLTFDLELNKYISRIAIQTSKGTKAYDYKNENFAKVEIPRKQINGALVVLEYTIKVKNNGEATGFAKNIVDYLPSGLTFSSELNRDWYLSENYLYTKSLENVQLKPGEEKEIKLILTKTMTAENVGLVNNRAEIYEDYNEYGIADIDSTPNNQKQEDDLSSADVIILVATGGESIMAYMILLMTNIILIGIAIKLMIKNHIIKIPTKKERR